MILVKTYGQFEDVKSWKREENVGKRTFLKTAEKIAVFAQVPHDLRF